jgi:predicted short-subunit dehydrogenase-like oxidoreductase (DUF2520 family)
MRITLIGSGNVATHLGAAFKNAGHHIIQVYSRDIQQAALLAYHVKAVPVDSIAQINADTDVFIIAIKDDAIGHVAQALSSFQKLILHTSGSTGLDVLLKCTSMAGVFYPLQTFSKTKELDFSTVPLCIEAPDAGTIKLIKELAQTVSNHVYEVDSARRQVLHLGAVFACNFPNYLYSIAQQLLAKNNLDFDMIRPLIAETADKVIAHLPSAVQTGPAVRNDIETMNKHLEMLQNEPYAQQIYELLSQGIIKMDKGLTDDK